MRDLESISAEVILRIQDTEALFSESIEQAKSEYRVLVRRWHPDHEKALVAPLVFSHIVNLYKCAVRKLHEGTWHEPAEKIEEEKAGVKKFKLANGSIKGIEYIAVRPFELGTMYIGDHTVVFEVGNEFEDLFRNGCRRISGLRFQNLDMAVEMSKYLPQIEDRFETVDANVLTVRKTPDQLLLADVLKHFGGRVPEVEHVGWILNALLNLCCYLDWAGLAHNAISPATMFVSPSRHSCMLLGGWWYSALTGTRLIALPDRSCDIIPPSIISNKRADCRSDLELTKAVGRELLGDLAGARLSSDKSLPRKLVSWLQRPSDGRAKSDYAEWKHDVLLDSFGRPKFVDLKLESTELYKEV